MSTPAELLSEFRNAVEQHLRDHYGKPADAGGTSPPDSDDHYLVAFDTASSVDHPIVDPCTQLEAATDLARNNYLNLDGQVSLYDPTDLVDVEQRKHSTAGHTSKQPRTPPASLVQARDQAKSDWEKKQAELAACQQQPVAGQICYELHRAGGTDSYWLCVPHPSASAYLWYEFARQSDGSFVSVPHPKLTSTPYPFWVVEPSQPVIAKTGDWTGNTDYGTWEGATGLGPPHWSPVLVVEGTHEEELVVHTAHHAAKEWVKVPNPPDPAVVKKLHDLMSSPATVKQGVAMIDAARPIDKDLRDRVGGHFWPPITLRGRVEDSGFSGEDYTGDHGTAYVEDGGPSPGAAGTDISWLAFFGPIGLATAATVGADHIFGDDYTVHDTSWPGMDWDIHVTADADVQYLCSVDRPTDVEIEIEHFALQPPNYRPHTNDWLQTTGRWVFDCGHSDNGEHHTEIHPPELVVASHLAGAATHAAAVTTGAWLGTTLSFVVFPPPRPSVTSHLQVSVQEHARRLCSLICEPWPKENPNHVVCTITPDKVTESQAARIDPWDTGLVAMSKARNVWALIQCFWAEEIAAVSVDAGEVGPRVYYRETDVAGSGWQEVPQQAQDVGPQQKIWQAALPPKRYTFRGAGSGWDYGEETVLLNVGANQIVLHPTRETYPEPSVQLSAVTSVLDVSVADPSTEDQWYYLKQAAIETLADSLVQWKFPSSTLCANPPMVGSGDKVSAELSVCILGWVNDDGTPAADLDSLIDKPLTTATGAQGYEHIYGAERPFVKGRSGAPIAGARLAVQLVLGNDIVGRHTAAEAQVVTDASGLAAFIIAAGSHPEDVSLQLNVLENPFNVWFTPTVVSPSVFFGPGAQADLAPGRTPYTLMSISDMQLGIIGIDASAITRAFAAGKSQSGQPPTLIVRPFRPIQPPLKP
jgi:hypothetical protein